MPCFSSVHGWAKIFPPLKFDSISCATTQQSSKLQLGWVSCAGSKSSEFRHACALQSVFTSLLKLKNLGSVTFDMFCKWAFFLVDSELTAFSFDSLLAFAVAPSCKPYTGHDRIKTHQAPRRVCAHICAIIEAGRVQLMWLSVRLPLRWPDIVGTDCSNDLPFAPKMQNASSPFRLQSSPHNLQLIKGRLYLQWCRLYFQCWQAPVMCNCTEQMKPYFASRILPDYMLW